MKQAISMRALLEWAYRDQRVHRMVGIGFGDGAPDGASSTWARVRSLAELGCSVQSSGRAFGGSVDAHPDAETVHAAVYGLPMALRRLVTDHAKAGSVPEWRVELGWEPKWGWDVDAKGRKRPMEYNRDGDIPGIDGWTGRQPIYCTVVPTGTADEVLMMREVYGSWREALDVLAGHFRSHQTLLRDYRVVEAGAEAAPWMKKSA